MGNYILAARIAVYFSPTYIKYASQTADRGVESHESQTWSMSTKTNVFEVDFVKTKHIFDAQNTPT